jgi:hypothetical protein
MTSAQPDKFSQKRKTTHKEEQESAAIRKVFAKEKDHPQRRARVCCDPKSFRKRERPPSKRRAEGDRYK